MIYLLMNIFNICICLTLVKSQLVLCELECVSIMSDHVRVPWNGWEIKSIIGNRNYSTIYEIERTMASIPETAAMKVISIPPERYSIEDAYSDGYDDNTLSEFQSYSEPVLHSFYLPDSRKKHHLRLPDQETVFSLKDCPL